MLAGREEITRERPQEEGSDAKRQMILGIQGGPLSSLLHALVPQQSGRRWWHMPLFPALWRQRQRQADLCEFKASLVYKERSRTARDVTQRNLVLENKNKHTTAKFLQ